MSSNQFYHNHTEKDHQPGEFRRDLPPLASDLERTLSAVWPEAQLLEMRVYGTDKGTVSGYYDDYRLLAKDAAQWDGKGQVCVTLNPINPDLRARCYNRFNVFCKDTTADADVRRRGLLFLDFDAQRPSGISATEEEHAQAIHIGTQCADWLHQELGWPELFVADSGNGCHLLASIDLPNDKQSADLLHRVLEAVAGRYDNEMVKVDQRVWNAARVIKLWGTMAVKGENLPDRPHRRSRAIRLPLETPKITRTMLEGVAALSGRQSAEGATSARPQSVENSARAFDLRAFIGQHGLSVWREEAEADGHRFHLVGCPFNADHRNGDSSLIQFSTGAVGFKCFHDSCAGKTWQDVREFFEPGYKDKRQGGFVGSVGSVGSEKDEKVAWPPFIPFGEADLQPFPTEVFPEWLREYVERRAHYLQVPIDLVGLMVIGAVSTAVMGKAKVDLGDGWTEHLNTYTCTVAGSGERKTQVKDGVFTPLEAFEHRMMPIREAEISREKSRASVLEEQLVIARKGAAKSANSDHADRISAQLASINIPSPYQLLASGDVTPEAVALVLQEQNGLLAIVDDEGSLFKSMSRYSASNIPHLSVFTQAFTGQTIRANRIKRGRVYVPNALLTIALSVQPGVIRSLAAQPALRGEGFLARFLWAWPKSKVGFRDTQPQPVGSTFIRSYSDNMDALLRMEPDTADDGSTSPHLLQLSDEAAALFQVYRAEVEVLLRPGSVLGELQDWGNRLCGQVARLAGILHMASYAAESAPWYRAISVDQMERAVSLGRYFLPHTRALFAEMGLDPMVEQARTVLDKIVQLCREGNKDTMTQRDLHHALESRFARSADLVPTLELLTERNYIRPIPYVRRPEGGRPTTIYQVNPAALQAGQRN